MYAASSESTKEYWTEHPASFELVNMAPTVLPVLMSVVRDLSALMIISPELTVREDAEQLVTTDIYLDTVEKGVVTLSID